MSDPAGSEPASPEPVPRPAARFTDFIQAHVEKTDPNRIVIDKLATRRIGAEAGVALPELYGLHDSAETLDLAALPDRFVLKPVHLAARQGVYLLTRTGRDSYHDLMSGRCLSGATIHDELRALTAGRRGGLIAEQMISDESGAGRIPCDYKLYTFNEGVALIIRYDRNLEPLSLCLMGGDFAPLSPGRFRLERGHGQLVPAPPPANAAQMLDACRALMAVIDRPFMRIDLYTNGQAVILGELTPSPGGAYHGIPYALSPEFDAELGALMIRGYLWRGWPVPAIAGTPPSRWADRIFAAAAGRG